MKKSQYEQLEHSLPPYDVLNTEFEISTIEGDAFPLRKIKRKIADKLEPLLDTLEHIINPDPNRFTDMYEARHFNSAERKELLTIFQHLMEHYRLLLETDVLADDKNDAQAITAVTTAWQNAKQQLQPHLKKLRECWQHRVEPQHIVDYLG